MRRSTKLEWLCSVLVPSVIAITACSPALDQARSEPPGGGADPVVETDTTAGAADDEMTSETFPPARPSGRSSGDVDAAAANGAVPPGTELTFQSDNFDLDEDGDYSASLAAPVGWQSRLFIGVEFEPQASAGLGFFTRLSAQAGCDGLCEATDWEARLNGPDGYLSMLEEGANVVDRREVSGSEGVVLTVEDSFGTTVTVLRWDDSADHYFECEAVLDEGAADLAPAFEAACLAARPDWFPVG